MMQNTFFLYARKSTDDAEHQVRSIDDQLAELREMAKREGIAIAEVFVEKQTAKCPGRPIFNEMLDRIEHRDADGILSWHPDRLARNAIDGGRIIHLADTGAIRYLRFPTYWFEPTPQGKFMLSIAFGQSKYYVDNLSENVRRAQRQKLAAGHWCWQAPVGYLNDAKTCTILLDPAKAHLVREAFILYSTGRFTLVRLRDELNALHLRGWRGKPLSTSNCQELLTNPFYYGVMRVNGELYSGVHEPLITKNTFEHVQAMLQKKSKPNSPHHKPYAYRGLFRCGECGCVITAETQKGHTYLRCTKRKGGCSQPYAREEHVTEQIASILTSVSIPDPCADWMLRHLATLSETELAGYEPTLGQMEGLVNRTDARLDRLMAGYLDGSFTTAEYRKAKAQLVNQRQEFKEKATTLKQTHSDRFERISGFIRRSKQAKNVASHLNPTEMRLELETVGSNLLLTNRRVHWEPRGAWKTVADPRFLRFLRKTAPRPGAAPLSESEKVKLWSPSLDRVRLSLSDLCPTSYVHSPSTSPRLGISAFVNSSAS